MRGPELPETGRSGRNLEGPTTANGLKRACEEEEEGDCCVEYWCKNFWLCISLEYLEWFSLTCSDLAAASAIVHQRLLPTSNSLK